MNKYLDTANFPCATAEEEQALASALEAIVSQDFKGEILPMLASYQKILGDNQRRAEW
jgi:hypothetical protein